MNDITIAEMYIMKSKSTKLRGLAFELSFTEYKRLVTTMTCAYTGIKMSQKIESGVDKPTDRTIERIDSKKGYSKDNCVSVCRFANTFKGRMEDINYSIDFNDVKKMVKRLDGKFKAKANLKNKIKKNDSLETRLGALRSKIKRK